MRFEGKHSLILPVDRLKAVCSTAAMANPVDRPFNNARCGAFMPGGRKQLAGALKRKPGHFRVGVICQRCVISLHDHQDESTARVMAWSPSLHPPTLKRSVTDGVPAAGGGTTLSPVVHTQHGTNHFIRCAAAPKRCASLAARRSVNKRAAGSVSDEWLVPFPVRQGSMLPVALVVLLLFMGGCRFESTPPPLEDVVIVQVYFDEETGQDDWHTVVQFPDGTRVDRYGNYGKIGDKFRARRYDHGWR